MSVTKLDKPLVIKGSNAYPLTSADQIIKADGSRLETENGISVDNAEKLSGYSLDYFTNALKVENFRHEWTTTEVDEVTKTFTVTKAGIIWLNLNIYSDATSDTGSTKMIIKLNDVWQGALYHRLSSAGVYNQGGNCSAVMKVEVGDIISCLYVCTKNGSKDVWIQGILCQGCEVDFSAIA